MAELDAEVKRSLKATATISIAEAFTDGQLSVSESSHPFARILEFLDSKICALCASVRGKVLRKDSDEFRKWRLPSHINCRRTISHLREGEVNFEEPDPELVRKHGHYHLDPDKYAELRVPAEPAGRNFIRRRVKNPETGEVGVALDWAPWWEQIPQWKRDLVLQARGTTSATELRGILAKLGITDPTDPDQLREAMKLALEDRLKGFLTTNESGPDDDEPPPASGLEKIDERLRGLTGDSLSFWADAKKRRRVLRNFGAALETRDERSIESVARRIDKAIVDGLEAMGLPRGRIRELQIVETHGAAGVKAPNCDLRLSPSAILKRVRDRPDTIFGLWTHESLHARLRFDDDCFTEYGPLPGFEEGMVQGLMIEVCRAAGMDIRIGPYKHYVEAYRALAEELELDTEELWRELWKNPPGTVRANLPRTIDVLRSQQGKERLSREQRFALFGLDGAADQLFDRRLWNLRVHPAKIRETWRQALQDP